MLTDVIYAPKLRANLLAVGWMTGSNINVLYRKESLSLTLNGMILVHGPKTNNLFTYVAFSIPKNGPEIARYTAEPSEITIWHYRLAHRSYLTLENMKKLKTVQGFELNIHYRPIPQCHKFPYRKQTCAPFKQMEDLPLNVGNIIILDICSPSKESMGRYKYSITWTDLKTRFVSIDFLKDKECGKVMESFKWYMAWLIWQMKANVKRIRTENGGVSTWGVNLHTSAVSLIIHKTTSPYTPEHNGITVRHNRTLQEGALTLQHDAKLSGRFWVLAVHMVNFIKNWVLQHHLSISPHESFWGKKPNIDWLKTYSCRCWALILKHIQKKGQYKSVEGISVGYFNNSNLYKIWVPQMHTILKAGNPIFYESNHIEWVTIHPTEDDDLPSLWIDEPPISISPQITLWVTPSCIIAPGNPYQLVFQQIHETTM